MEKVTKYLLLALHIGELVFVGFLIFLVISLANDARRITVAIESAPKQLTDEVDKQSYLIRKDLFTETDLIRRDLFSQVTMARESLDAEIKSSSAQLLQQLGSSQLQVLKQSSSIAESSNALLAHVDANTATSMSKLNILLDSSAKLVNNEDIPGLIRDARFTMAFTGQTMRHVETVSDSLAQAAPATTQAVQGIATDVHKVTNSITKPQPWYKKILYMAVSASNVAKFF